MYVKLNREDYVKNPEVEHIGLLNRVVRQTWHHWVHRQGVTEEELFNIGYIALKNAYNGFDPSLGKKFSNYAAKIINRDIGLYVMRLNWLSIPGNLLWQCNRLKSGRGINPKFQQSMENDPNLAKRFKCAKRAFFRKRGPHTSPARYSSWEVEEQLERNQLITTMDLVRFGLSQIEKPRNRRILELRFGIPDGNSYTYEEIAKMYGKTKQAIWCVEQKELKVIRRAFKKAGVMPDFERKKTSKKISAAA